MAFVHSLAAVPIKVGWFFDHWQIVQVNYLCFLLSTNTREREAQKYDGLSEMICTFPNRHFSLLIRELPDGTCQSLKKAKS